MKTGAKSLAKKVARKAAFGLAASAAVLGALGASHGHGTAQEPATKTVAAVSSAVSGQSAKGADGTSDAQGAHLTTTFHHPFYDETQSAFVEAKDLKAGDVLQTPTGTAEVTGVRLYHANTATYDLTIGTLHTYYVVAGTTPVLVHNCGTESVAADLAETSYGGKTVGQAVRINSDGSATKLGKPLISGRSALAEKVNSALEEAGVKMPSNGRFSAAEHPDIQFAYLMRESKSGITSADIVITKVGGACEGDYSCSVVIPKLLPKGSTLRVHSPLEGGGMRVQEFVGQ
ncbi:DddA-like double-stranded DNA deaminase toxin [Streptomyces hokutonensis]|uniref:DddA-like double-stranded DNA deaminase toxin n=1 Tax=Streptomyces hokutonensis TaxID=1306990 RepID=UPI0034014390